MTNTPTTYTNDLLALLLALQSPTVGTLAEDFEMKMKLRQLGNHLAGRPDDWEDIDGHLKTILQGNPDLKREHEKFLAQLANLTPETLLGLLPTEEERQTVLSSEKVPFFAPTPRRPDRRQDTQAHTNVSMVIATAEAALNGQMPPQEACNMLLQRVLKWLGNQGK